MCRKAGSWIVAHEPDGVIITAPRHSGRDYWTQNPAYTVTYNGNGGSVPVDAASGSVPLDTTRYEEGQTVTVLGNTGNLAVTNGKVFYGWIRSTVSSFVYYHAGDTFVMGSANERLSAVWAYPDTITLVYDDNGSTSGTVPAPPTEYNGLVWVQTAENRGNLQRTGYTFSGWYATYYSLGNVYTQTYTPGEYFLMSGMLPGYSISDNTVTLLAKWTPRATLLYNAGTHNGDFGGLAGANAICKASMPEACGTRTKVHAFMGRWADVELADIPSLTGIDADLPIVGPNGLQVSADWSVLGGGVYQDWPSCDNQFYLLCICGE